jgi:hypothetical protein
MPVKDVDGGLVWNNYNPKMFGDKSPAEQYVSKPFYFGGSQVPMGLSNPQLSSNDTSLTPQSRSKISMRKVMKLPSMRKNLTG